MLNAIRTFALAALLALAAFLPAPARAVDDLQDYSTTANSNTDIAGINFAEGMPPANVNNGVRALIAQLKRAVANQGSDIASASSTAICATGTSAYVKVTGTTTITSFGTAAAGCSRWVTFTGALQITHNATSMILPGGANFTTAAGDMIWAVSEGSGNWRVRVYPASGVAVVPNSNGVHKLFVPAQGLSGYPGFAPAFTEQVPGGYPYASWDFDASSIEAVYFQISMPSSWNEGTITFVPVWTAASGSGNVVFDLHAYAIGDNEVLNPSLGALVTSTDTLQNTGRLHRGPVSSALTIDGTPAANDMVLFRLRRNAPDAGDTLNADAKLLGIEIFLTTDSATDAP